MDTHTQSCDYQICQSHTTLPNLCHDHDIYLPVRQSLKQRFLPGDDNLAGVSQQSMLTLCSSVLAKTTQLQMLISMACDWANGGRLHVPDCFCVLIGMFVLSDLLRPCCRWSTKRSNASVVKPLDELSNQFHSFEIIFAQHGIASRVYHHIHSFASLIGILSKPSPTQCRSPIHNKLANPKTLVPLG